MGIGSKIQKARREAGLTQEQLAAKVYVTRQAVSRWETGESEPGIDMRKLLASTLDVPVASLLDLPESPTCQCCGTPFDIPDMPFGTNADGTENPDYCGWCYRDGEFTSAGLDEIIERNVPYLMQATGYSAEEAVSFMGALLPTLKRWSGVENRNVSANLKRSAFYVCPDCANVIWSAGEAAISCCGNALEPLGAKKNANAPGAVNAVGALDAPDAPSAPDAPGTPDVLGAPGGPETLDAFVEVSDGCQRVHITHPRTKDDHLLFIAAVGDDLVRIKRLYPEQEARAEFGLRGPCKLYTYGNSCGLIEL